MHRHRPQIIKKYPYSDGTGSLIVISYTGGPCKDYLPTCDKAHILPGSHVHVRKRGQHEERGLHGSNCKHIMKEGKGRQAFNL